MIISVELCAAEGGETVKKQWRQLLLAAVIAGALALLSGCSMPELVFNPEELYSLPELPVKYTELNSRINAVLEGGAEYAAPTSGTNIQPVQLVDLNGDGQEEALAFFRNSADEKPLKIYIFEGSGDSYEQSDLIEASGTSISSIAYNDLNGDGVVELIVGWKAAAELQVLEVYSRKSGSAEPLVRTNYVRYITADLERDGRQELVVLRADEEGGSVADYYRWQSDGTFAGQTSARISVTMAELSQQGRVSVGALQGDLPALFITGVTDTPETITDILTLRNGELSNISLSEQSGLSAEISMFCGLYPSDINDDGLTEVPRPVYTENQTGPGMIAEWFQYGADGTPVSVLRTCHNIADGWFFRMPEAWRDAVRTSRAAGSGETSVVFYVQDTAQPFLRIAAYTGTNRELRAVRGNQFLLSRQPETIYTAELLEANESWEHGATADEIRAGFSLILSEWTTGNN